jgi:WD40 repeat protein
MKTSWTFLKSAFWTTTIIVLFIGNLFGQNEGISKILWTANWSNDGKYIAVGGVDKKIRIYSGKSFDLIKVFDNNTEILRMSWHPHSNLLAVAATNDGSKLIDIEKDLVIRLNGDKGFGSRSIAWNYSGELLANADYEGEITLWTKHGELIRTIRKENTISNVALDWHPSKNEFVVLSELIRVYNSEGNLLNKFNHRKEQVLMLCVKWHKTGKYFVLGDYGDHNYNYRPLLQYWDANGTLIKEINASKAEYRNMSWTKNGKKLATASDALRIWDADGNLIAEGPSEDKLWGVDWSPDGKFIVTSSHNGHIKLWDRKAKLIRELSY